MYKCISENKKSSRKKKGGDRKNRAVLCVQAQPPLSFPRHAHAEPSDLPGGHKEKQSPLPWVVGVKRSRGVGSAAVSSSGLMWVFVYICLG